MNSTTPAHIHFIAIGGAAMHNLALALHQNGQKVTGSDDEILEPSRSRLTKAGLIPPAEGWFPEKLASRPETVILGMHARSDNPELLEAQRLGLNILSYPEFLYEQSKNKQRVVIGGSHGKTTITSMILFVLEKCGIDFDYMVGAKIEGFDTMVRLSDAPLMIIEGDEYLSSPIDRRPKFHLYRADIGLISGIAWDHFNVFPEYSDYTKQFRIFAERIPPSGALIYCANDPETVRIIGESKVSARKIPYNIPAHQIINGITYLNRENNPSSVPLKVFGDHNLMNIEGAREVCELLGVKADAFYEAIQNFKGAARRLELIASNQTISVFKDFAHSPSKLKATTDAVRKQYPGRKVIACMELHTFSSLNDDFLGQYKGTMDNADISVVYYNPHTIAHKKLKELNPVRVREAFANSSIRVLTDSEKFKEELLKISPGPAVFLLMSSGNFDGLPLEELALKLTTNN